MKQLICVSLALAATCGVSQTAHAAEETWRLTATIDQIAPNLTPPAYASVGAVITVDYRFTDLDTSTQNSIGFMGVTSLVSINGQELASDSYAINWEGLKALNTSVNTGAADDLRFMSLNAFSSNLPNASLRGTLNDIASNIAIGNAEFRLDFGDSNSSIYALPTSLTPVPEMSTMPMLVLGLVGLAAAARRQTSRPQA